MYNIYNTSASASWKSNNEDYIIYYIISLQVHASDADSGSNGLVRYTRIIGDAVMQVLVSIRIVIISKK